jgi:succinoglycan biosynthesis protein ExoO
MRGEIMGLTRPEEQAAARPLISVVMANYQAGDKLIPAIESVLRQTVGDLELIVCDDASDDHSVMLVERFVRADKRVSLISAQSNGGPARSRNRGLAAARGQWIAIVDSDDIIHPERFERLLAAARHFDAGIVADDMLHFYEDGAPVGLLLGRDQNMPFAVGVADWIGAGLAGSPPLGYLKPLIRADILGEMRYEEGLRIGEDYDLILRLLLAEAAMVVVPQPYYLYRRHSGSISHRLSVSDLAAMIRSQEALMAELEPLPLALSAAFAARHQQLNQGLDFERLVETIKQRRVAAAISILMQRPALAPRLWQAFAEGRRRKALPPLPQRLLPGTLALGPSGRAVPDYVPVHEIDWSMPCLRQAWLDIVDLAGGQPIDVICGDEASRYAAGFIPLARVRDASTGAGISEMAG